MQEFINTLIMKKEELFLLCIEHIQLTAVAIIMSVLIGVCLGIFITKNKKMASIVIGVANLMQSIPSLAILGFLIPIVGIGAKPAIIMVILYSILPIVKNTYTALMNINPDTIEAAKGIGMTPRQILIKIKIPLAMPVIMAGVRIASVTAVGLMTIAAFVGAGGLGYLVFSGIQTVNNHLILLGAIPAAILALLMDYVIGVIEKSVTPNGIKGSNGELIIKNSKKTPKTVIVILIIIGLSVGILGKVNFVKTTGKDTIVIGSKNFTEQLIVGSMLAYLIEEETDLNVETKLNLGGTQVAFGALKKGDIDLYVDYTGTMLLNVLGEENIYNTPEEMYTRVKEQYREKFGIETLPTLGFNNTYALAVRPDTKEKYNLKTISDLKAIEKELIAGTTIEFANRIDGLIGVQEVYDLNFKEVKAVDGALRYSAIDSGESDVIDVFKTDGLVEEFDLVVLEDDKNFFAPYYAVPLVREDTLIKYPELEKVLETLTGQITDQDMMQLNYRVDVQGKAPEKVAHDFLVERGYIK